MKSVPVLAFLSLLLASCATPQESALADTVRLALFRDPVLVGYPIAVSAQDDAVYMTGTVSTSVMIDRATKVASAVPGVRRVYNTIAIDNPTGF